MNVNYCMRILERHRRSALESSWQQALRLRSKSDRVHVAAVCYRLHEGRLEFLLVRTRNGHWTFPKGGVDQDPTNADAAAREAYEEAGVSGWVEPTPFVSYLHCKPGQLRSRSGAMLVDAHLCEVKRLVPPLEGHRNPTWFTRRKAKRRLRELRTPEFANEVVRVIDCATERILLRHPDAGRVRTVLKYAPALWTF
jgi:8-oxo-dGTP pyrophosphatase MutT (NUDIX family)